MADRIGCPSKAAALAAMGTIAESIPPGTRRDALAAVARWVEGNIPDDLPGLARERLARIFEGTVPERAGRAWVEREIADPGYSQGYGAACSEAVSRRFVREAAGEPEDGAELRCFWDSASGAWHPAVDWPEAKDRGRGDGE